MESKNLVSMVLAVTVSLICIASVMMPVLSDATTTEKTFTNDGYFRMSEYDDSDYKVVWDHTAPSQVTINDTEVVSFEGMDSYQAVTYVATDEFAIRFLNDPSNPRVQIYGTSTWGFTSASVSSATDITMTVSEGSTTISTTADPVVSITSTTPSVMYVVDAAGDFVMKDKNSSAYVLNDSNIVLCGITQGTNLEAGVYAAGDVIDGLTYQLFRPSSQSETAVFSDEVITSSAVSGYIGLQQLDKINFALTLSNQSLSPEYTYFIVPYQVTAELSDHLNAGEISLIMVIPLIVIVSLLAIVVRAINRD